MKSTLATATRAEEQLALQPIFRRGDRLVRWAIGTHLLIALALADAYDTWRVTVIVGGLAASMFFACAWLLPGHFVTRCVAGISLQAFCALHIFQLHGMAEMHFFFFTSFTLLIFYKDPASLWPGAILIIGQHILFAVLHNSGVQLFFFDQPVVGFAKLFFHFGIAIADVAIASMVAHNLRKRTLDESQKSAALTAALERSQKLVAELEQTRDRLVNTEKLAAAGQLAAGVGHEINNPLSFIQGNLRFLKDRLVERPELLRGYEGSGELIECIDEADEGARRIAAIVRDLRTFARSDTTTVEPVDVRGALEFALSMAGPQLRHRARVERDLQAVPAVLANEARLGQVFLALLVNAAQAMKDGDAATNRLLVRTVRQGDFVRVSICDTGGGISEDVLPRVFDPFFTTKPVGQGTGLGLSIAYGIVTEIGGRIEVESAPGKGASFHVSLRATALPAVARTRKTPPQVQVPETPVKVLVIDDEPGMPALVQRLLGDGAQVEGVANGHQALEAIGLEDYDLILCDIMMPDVSGIEVWSTLVKERPDLLSRVVMVTGGVFSERAEAFVKDLPHEPLSKPFDAAVLRGLVEKARSARAA